MYIQESQAYYHSNKIKEWRLVVHCEEISKGTNSQKREYQ